MQAEECAGRSDPGVRAPNATSLNQKIERVGPRVNANSLRWLISVAVVRIHWRASSEKRWTQAVRIRARPQSYPKSLRSRRATCRRRQWKAQRISRRRALWFSLYSEAGAAFGFPAFDRRQEQRVALSQSFRCRSHFSDPILSSSGRLKTVRTPLDNATRRRSRNRLSTRLTWTGVSPTASAMCCWRNGKG